LYHDRAEARDKMTTLCEILRNSTPEIVKRWLEFVDQPPWSELSEADRLDELPLFLESLYECTVCSSPSGRQPGRFLHAAAMHGEQRRRCGLSYDQIMEESALLRRAVWEFAKPHPHLIHEMVKIDSALTTGLLASLRGYSKPELEARGDWETTLARLNTDWTAMLRD
jgi:hypothetical protein